MEKIQKEVLQALKDKIASIDPVSFDLSKVIPDFIEGYNKEHPDSLINEDTKKFIDGLQGKSKENALVEIDKVLDILLALEEVFNKIFSKDKSGNLQFTSLYQEMKNAGKVDESGRPVITYYIPKKQEDIPEYFKKLHMGSHNIYESAKYFDEKNENHQLVAESIASAKNYLSDYVVLSEVKTYDPSNPPDIVFSIAPLSLRGKDSCLAFAMHPREFERSDGETFNFNGDVFFVEENISKGDMSHTAIHEIMHSVFGFDHLDQEEIQLSEKTITVLKENGLGSIMAQARGDETGVLFVSNGTNVMPLVDRILLKMLFEKNGVDIQEAKKDNIIKLATSMYVNIIESYYSQEDIKSSITFLVNDRISYLPDITLDNGCFQKINLIIGENIRDKGTYSRMSEIEFGECGNQVINISRQIPKRGIVDSSYKISNYIGLGNRLVVDNVNVDFKLYFSDAGEKISGVKEVDIYKKDMDTIVINYKSADGNVSNFEIDYKKSFSIGIDTGMSKNSNDIEGIKAVLKKHGVIINTDLRNIVSKSLADQKIQLGGK